MEKDSIEELNLKLDVAIIKPYLKSKGFDLTPKHEYDRIAYYVARKGDIRYLAFGIDHYNPDDFGLTDYELGCCGQIVYDVNGNVLLDCIDKRSELCSFWLKDAEHYEEIKSSDVFMDDYILLSVHSHWKAPLGDCRKVEGPEEYEIYKLEENGYVLHAKFDNPSEGVLKSSGGELFINDYGKLYGVRAAKHLNDIKFKDIKGAESGFDRSIDHLPKDAIDAIEAKLKNDNVLFAYDHIYEGAGDYFELATIFAFLDIQGNIVSKLYCRCTHDFFTLDVDNDSYAQAVECCKKKMRTIINKRVGYERRRENREVKKKIKDNADMTLAIMESLSGSTESKELSK